MEEITRNESPNKFSSELLLYMSFASKGGCISTKGLGIHGNCGIFTVWSHGNMGRPNHSTKAEHIMKHSMERMNQSRGPNPALTMHTESWNKSPLSPLVRVYRLVIRHLETEE